MAAMATLHVRLLGRFSLLVARQPLAGREWRSQQVRTILKVLLLRRGSPVPAEQLLELLWPDGDPQATRRRLHVRISQLRRALDRDAPSAYVLSVQGGYAFNPQADCWLDTAEFERQAALGDLCRARGALAEAVEAYESARALYRGDLLEEDLYEDWAAAERERLRGQFLALLMELAECYAQEGRYRHAIDSCRQVLAIDPCHEAAVKVTVRRRRRSTSPPFSGHSHAGRREHSTAALQ